MARIIKDRSKFNKLIDNTIKAGKSFKDQLQSALSSACYHVMVHGDITVLNKLIVETNDLVADNSHKKWVVENAGQLVKWENEKIGFTLKDQNVKAVRADNDAMLAYEERFENADPYYVLTPAKAFTGMNVLSMLHAIVKKHENLEKKKAEQMEAFGLSEEDWKGKVDLHGLSQVKLLIANLSAGTSEKVMDMSGTGTPDNGNDNGSGSAHYIN